MKGLRWGLMCVVALSIVVTSGCTLPKLVWPEEYNRLRTMERLNRDQAALIAALAQQKALAMNKAQSAQELADAQRRAALDAAEALKANADLLEMQRQALETERKRTAELQQLADNLKGEVARLESEGSIGPINVGGGLETTWDPVLGVGLRIPNKLLFASGSAVLKKSAGALIGEIAKIDQVKDERNILRVCGFTDSDPIKKSKFKDNYALSSERARQVLKALAKNGITEGRMHIMAFGPHKLIMGADGKESKSKSRRVEIYFVPPPKKK